MLRVYLIDLVLVRRRVNVTDVIICIPNCSHFNHLFYPSLLLIVVSDFLLLFWIGFDSFRRDHTIWQGARRLRDRDPKKIKEREGNSVCECVCVRETERETAICSCDITFVLSNTQTHLLPLTLFFLSHSHKHPTVHCVKSENWELKNL